ncbi:MAG: hypothetical protein AMJ73_00090 [candidate division Zixibacteria bacterium SM1_73]|nr:MAG: hypothetical protein AMJ73_00090 [candidate division Zixibacteria bacterium SM1_73]
MNSEKQAFVSKKYPSGFFTITLRKGGITKSQILPLIKLYFYHNAACIIEIFRTKKLLVIYLEQFSLVQ